MKPDTIREMGVEELKSKRTELQEQHLPAPAAEVPRSARQCPEAQGDPAGHRTGRDHPQGEGLRDRAGLTGARDGRQG